MALNGPTRAPLPRWGRGLTGQPSAVQAAPPALCAYKDRNMLPERNNPGHSRPGDLLAWKGGVGPLLTVTHSQRGHRQHC